MPAFIARMLISQLVQHSAQIRVALFRRYTGLQASDAVHKMASAIIRASFKRERIPYIHCVAVGDGMVVIAGMLHAGRHHTDDRERHCIQSD